MKVNKLVKIAAALSLTLTALSAKAEVQTLQNLNGLRLKVIDGQVLSNCFAGEPQYCQNTNNVKIADSFKPYVAEAQKLTDERKQRLAAYQNEIGTLEQKIGQLKESDTFKLIDLEVQLKQVKSKFKELENTKSSNELMNARYGTLFNEKSRRETEFYAPLFTMGALGSASDVRLYQKEHAYEGELQIQYHSSMGMRMLIKFDLEWMIATCEQRNVTNTLLGVDVPGSKQIELQCTMPNKRGFIRFAVE